MPAAAHPGTSRPAPASPPQAEYPRVRSVVTPRPPLGSGAPSHDGSLPTISRAHAPWKISVWERSSVRSASATEGTSDRVPTLRMSAILSTTSIRHRRINPEPKPKPARNASPPSRSCAPNGSGCLEPSSSGSSRPARRRFDRYRSASRLTSSPRTSLIGRFWVALRRFATNLWRRLGRLIWVRGAR